VASGLNSKTGTHLDRLSSTLDYAAAFTRFIRAHELTGGALRRGQVRYHRAALILNRWAAKLGNLKKEFNSAYKPL